MQCLCDSMCLQVKYWLVKLMNQYFDELKNDIGLEEVPERPPVNGSSHQPHIRKMMRELYDEISVIGWGNLPGIAITEASSHPTPEDLEFMEERDEYEDFGSSSNDSSDDSASEGEEDDDSESASESDGGRD